MVYVAGYALMALAALVALRIILVAGALLSSGIVLGYAGLLLLGWFLERRMPPYYIVVGDYRKPW